VPFYTLLCPKAYFPRRVSPTRIVSMNFGSLLGSITFIIVSFCLIGSSLLAQDAPTGDLSAHDLTNLNIKGIITLYSSSGVESHAFKDISWVNGETAFYTDSSGAMTRSAVAGNSGVYTDGKGSDVKFSNDSVVSILFLDDNYRQAVNAKFNASMGEIAGKETTPPRSIVDLLSSSDFARTYGLFTLLNDAQADELEPYKTSLSIYIQKFKSGQRLIDGIWIPRQQNPLIGVYGPTSITLNGESLVDAYLFPCGNTNQVYVLTADGGTAVDYSALADQVNALPPQVAQLILQDNGKKYVGSIPQDHSTIAIHDFIPAAEQAMRTYQSVPEVTNTISSICEDTILLNVNNSSNRDYLWETWPSLCKSMNFSIQNRDRFYEAMLGSGGSMDDASKVLDYVSKSDPTCLSDQAIASCSSKLASFNNGRSLFDASLGRFLSDSRNSKILHTEPTLGEAPLSPLADGEKIMAEMQGQSGNTSMTDLKTRYTDLLSLWNSLSLITPLRGALASGDLKSALDVASRINVSGSTLSQSERQGAAIVESQLAYLSDRKASVDKLVNEADATISNGGNQSDAIEMYQKALQLDRDPAIQAKIDDIKKHSLGI
jgi:hypothetical protein